MPDDEKKAKKEKKIIIDEDWKAQARKEKEQSAEKEKAEREEKQEAPLLPVADFTGLVTMLATQAFFAMGLIRSEEQKEAPADLKLAKYNIDMLEVLEQKTKGGLTEEESTLLENTLHQLRMTFVKISQ